jgi:hypothetical protein
MYRIVQIVYFRPAAAQIRIIRSPEIMTALSCHSAAIIRLSQKWRQRGQSAVKPAAVGAVGISAGVSWQRCHLRPLLFLRKELRSIPANRG